MRMAGLWGPLWALFMSELQAAVESAEVKFTLTEGQTLSVNCPFTIWKFSNSQKAWQRLTDGGEPLTLAFTQPASGQRSEVQVGRYFLEEFPDDGILQVRVTNLQVEDSGLYRCVIYQPPKDPFLLFHPVCLVVTKKSSSVPDSEKNLTQNLVQNSTLSYTTTRNELHTSPRTVTQPLPSTTASLSSPGHGVNPIHVTDAIGLSLISIVLLVVCGILSKSLIFTVLLIVTQRSLGP